MRRAGEVVGAFLFTFAILFGLLAGAWFGMVWMVENASAWEWIFWIACFTSGLLTLIWADNR